MTRRPMVGDVFVVPLGDGRAGLGQVVAGYGNDAYYFAIFDVVLPSETAETASPVSSPVLFLALSMDAKLHAGHWVVVGHAPVAADTPFPAYKELVSTAGDFDVVDYTGSRRRPATSTEADALPNRKVIAPVRLEKALKASFGLEPWLAIFDELRPSGRAMTADLFD